MEKQLTKKYKVIADYPHSPYKIGDTIVLPPNNRSFHLTTIEYTDEFGESVRQQNWNAPNEILKYPHLFEPITDNTTRII